MNHVFSAEREAMQARFNQELLALLSVERITAEPMAPYFAEALEEGFFGEADDLADWLDPNAAMIARDGEARVHLPTIAASKEEKLASVNVHAPVAGLTFLGRVDHRLGLGR